MEFQKINEKVVKDYFAFYYLGILKQANPDIIMSFKGYISHWKSTGIVLHVPKPFINSILCCIDDFDLKPPKIHALRAGIVLISKKELKKLNKTDRNKLIKLLRKVEIKYNVKNLKKGKPPPYFPKKSSRKYIWYFTVDIPAVEHIRKLLGLPKYPDDDDSFKLIIGTTKNEGDNSESWPEEDNYTVEKSPIDGLGVFANKDFIPGEVIDPFAAVALPGFEQINNTIDEFNNLTRLVFSDLSRFINHSSTPNAIVVEDELHPGKILRIVSNRHIKKGEELLVDYEDANRKFAKVAGGPNYIFIYRGVPYFGGSTSGRFYYKSAAESSSISPNLTMFLKSGLLLSSQAKNLITENSLQEFKQMLKIGQVPRLQQQQQQQQQPGGLEQFLGGALNVLMLLFPQIFHEHGMIRPGPGEFLFERVVAAAIMPQIYNLMAMNAEEVRKFVRAVAMKFGFNPNDPNMAVFIDMIVQNWPAIQAVAAMLGIDLSPIYGTKGAYTNAALKTMTRLATAFFPNMDQGLKAAKDIFPVLSNLADKLRAPIDLITAAFLSHPYANPRRSERNNYLAYVNRVGNNAEDLVLQSMAALQIMRLVQTGTT
jgi:hypothetical protein